MLIEREMSEFTWSREEPQDEAGLAAPPAAFAAARPQPVPALQLLAVTPPA